MHTAKADNFFLKFGKLYLLLWRDCMQLLLHCHLIRRYLLNNASNINLLKLNLCLLVCFAEDTKATIVKKAVKTSLLTSIVYKKIFFSIGVVKTIHSLACFGQYIITITLPVTVNDENKLSGRITWPFNCHNACLIKITSEPVKVAKWAYS